jgi:hypothetical protein
MPVGVIAAIGKDDIGSPGSERRQRREHRVIEVRALVLALAVQEDQQRAARSPTGAGGNHRRHRQGLVHEPAADREAHDPRAVGVGAQRAHGHEDEDGGSRQRQNRSRTPPPQSASASRRS